MATTFRICLLPGDGIGPEILGEACKVLDAVGARYDTTFEYREALIGGCAIDATGTALPDDTLACARACDAVLLAAVGGPKWDTTDPDAPRPEQGLLGIRKGLGLYTNLRPVQLFDALADASTLKREVVEGVDLVIVRELTGGLYFGESGRVREARYAGQVGTEAGTQLEAPAEKQADAQASAQIGALPETQAGAQAVASAVGQQAFDTMQYHEFEIERIARRAFELARTRRGRVHSIDKANVLESSRLWREVVHRVHDEEFSDIELIDMLVDNAAMQLIRQPGAFDVVVTENMFGDILSDEAAQIAGSLGMLASASLGDGVALYEPTHGSAPDIAGRGIANPLAQILSIELMLRHSLNMPQAADDIRRAVTAVLDAGWRTADIRDSTTPNDKVVGTARMAELVQAAL